MNRERAAIDWPLPDEVAGRRRAIVEGVRPEIDCGMFPAKRTIGDRVTIEADVFTDGHDAVSAVLLYRAEDATDWRETPMQPLGNDRWRGEFVVPELGTYYYTVKGWVDDFKTWSRDLAKRVGAGQDVAVDLIIGAKLVDAAVARAPGEAAKRLGEASAALRAGGESGIALASSPELAELMFAHASRELAATYPRELRLQVDPVRARFSSWYELFPRSASPEPGRHGTLKDVEARLPYVAAMGFDVLYLPPIHPIGRAFRKGPNNSTVAGPDDTGSPWAIGSEEGGHKAIHPELGTIEDFHGLVRAARTRGIEIALDIAFQCSPDHPYVKEHPEWFRQRPDGTIQYAENPPKKYQDIYPFDFETPDWRGLWQELKSIFEYWIEQGVTIFRVDNPHTKAFPFWEWTIGAIKRNHPEVIFLSEAFTRPRVRYRLAKLGFTQSYTYFAWRNTPVELREYLTELTQTDVREFFRPNFWPNTPDILTEYLQVGGRPAFIARLVLAATLTANYGIYGPAFELLEHLPREHGSEEYLDSEKYQLRHWNLDRPESLRPLITRVNRIRRENPALQRNETLAFHPVDNDRLIAYSKTSADGENVILTIVSVDPHYRQSGWLDLNLEALGITRDQSFQMHDLLSDARYLWNGARNYVELDPNQAPAHVFRVRQRVRNEHDFEYFL